MSHRTLDTGSPTVAETGVSREIQKLLATLPVAAYLTDADGRTTYRNEAAAALWGIAPDRHETEQTLLGSVSDGTSDADSVREFLVKRPGGPGGVAAVRSTRIRDDSGRVVATANILAETSESQRLVTTLNALVDGLSPETGESFFRALVDRLCSSMGVDYALVSVFDPSRPGKARTIALSHRGVSAPDFEYDLEGTPCDILTRSDFCSFPEGLQERFPHDAILGRLGINAYVGTRLHAPDGGLIGLVAVMHGARVPDLGLVETLVRIVAARAGAELAGLQARRTLAERERFLRLSQTAGKAGSWELDPRTGRVRWSEETYRLFGRTADQFNGAAASIVDFIHADDRAPFNDALTASMKGVPPPEFEMRVLRPSGEERFLLVRGEIMSSPGAADVRIGGIVVDVTDQKRAEMRRRELERELRRSEDRYRRIVETTHAGVAVTDDVGRIVYANRRLESLLDTPPGGMVGKQFTAFALDGDDCSLLRPAMDVGPRQDEGSEIGAGRETRLRRSDGSQLRFRCDTTPLVDDEGVRTGMLILLQDETERLKLVDAQRKLQEGLILNDRLASVGTLAAGVAHEINNPLAYVRSNLELVMETLRDAGPAAERCGEWIRPLVEQALDGVGRVCGIVRGLKSFARAGEERRSVVDVRRVIDDAVGLAGHEAGHRAKLVKDYADAPPVEADPARLSQVFVNLIVNAAQAIPEGSLRSHEIRLRVREGADGSTVAEVSDDGVGMPPEVMARAFEPFFTTKPVGVGTGLGLSICHGIVQSLGGKIQIENRPTGGTTVRVILAAARHVAAPAAVAAPAPAPAPFAALEGSLRRRVLIVDDDPLVAEACSRSLARDYDTTIVGSGVEAAQILLRKSFDVVLCDLMMPGMTGMELQALLAGRSPEAAKNMVFMTGGAFTAAAIAFLEASENAFVEKPFSPAQLRSAIAAVADGATRAVAPVVAIDAAT